ncbi:MAG: type II secretion system protein [Tepidisphaeraceae bacterium]
MSLAHAKMENNNRISIYIRILVVCCGRRPGLFPEGDVRAVPVQIQELCMRSYPTSRTRGFTLVELLVVIGIIALLISMLLPALNAARKQADRVKCLSAMRQMGNAFFMYSGDNKGYWPMSEHGYLKDFSAGPARKKYWYDFVGKYLIGPTKVTDPATGIEYVSSEINFNGEAFGAGIGEREFWSVGDPVYIGTFRSRNSVLWGCPVWNRTSSSNRNGFAMNMYPLAPKDEATPFALNAAFFGKRNLRNSLADSSPADPGARHGQYFKQVQYTRAAERALLYEDIAPALLMPSAAITAWIWMPESNVRAWPQVPVVNSTDPSIDFNRHGKSPVGNKPNDPSLNILYCDGHAANVSARECYRAIRFH